MSLKEDKTLRVVLYEGEGAAPLPASDRFSFLVKALDKGFAVTRSAAKGAVSSSDRSSLLVLGDFAGSPPVADAASDGSSVRFRDISGQGSDTLLEWVEQTRTDSAAVRPGDWKPWFPVIDYDRCTNCMQCLSFCLFGVYGVDTQSQIQVQNNDNCKTNCPACSRVCPEAAIMFPKYKTGPINGDVVSDNDLNREKMKIDISSLLGGDVYSMLRERSERAQTRFSRERDSGKALAERQKCLTKLAQSGDIPAEVLMSLPSPDEIMRRAEEAKAKAQAALQQVSDAAQSQRTE